VPPEEREEFVRWAVEGELSWVLDALGLHHPADECETVSVTPDRGIDEEIEDCERRDFVLAPEAVGNEEVLLSDLNETEDGGGRLDEHVATMPGGDQAGEGGENVVEALRTE
jgi:hypothetical protein